MNSRCLNPSSSRLLMQGLLLAAVWAPRAAQAQVPPYFTVQGVLRDANNQLQSGTATIDIEFFSGELGQTSVWSTTTSPVIISGGVFTVELNLSTQMDLFNVPLWMKIKVNTDPPESLPMFRLTSVPYAFSASRVGDKSAADLQDKLTAVAPIDITGNQISLRPGGTCTNTSILKYDGTNWVCGPDQNSQYTAAVGGGLELTGNAFGIAASGVTSARLADNAVITVKIQNGAVDGNKLAALCVDASKIAADAVTTVKIANDAVTSAKIANDAVGSTEIASGAVGSEKLADGAVNSAKILNGSIATEDLANGAVDENKIAPQSIMLTHLDSAMCGEGQILKKVAAAWSCAQDADTPYAAGAGLDLSNGTFSIGLGAVDATMLATNAVTSDAILAGAVQVSDIGDAQVQANHIAPSVIDHTHLNGKDCAVAGQFWVNHGTEWNCASINTSGGASVTSTPTEPITISAAAGSHDEHYVWNATTTSMMSAQNASININGTIRTTAGIRIGSEVSTSAPPMYPSDSAGMVIRRIVSDAPASGAGNFRIIAGTNDAFLVRDTTNGGMFLSSQAAGARNAFCMGVTNAGGQRTEGVSRTTPGNTLIWDDGDSMLMINCILGDFSAAGHTTEVKIGRSNTGSGVWVGTLTSSYNQ